MTTSAIKRRRSSSSSSPPSESNSNMNSVTSAASVATLSKSDSEDAVWLSDNLHYLNPFVHRMSTISGVDLAKIYVLTVLLLPIRVVGCMLFLVTAWMFACIGLCGLSAEDLSTKPISGWRKIVKSVTATMMRLVYASGSFHYISFKGVRASPKEAPILVVAPHSSYIDSIIVVATTPPSIVAKKETSKIPLLGKIMDFAQPIYVQREDPNSRQNTIREIVTRARSSEEWPQVIVFSEGTCTNRKALIKFKPGAFYPGVPVQPVLLKYPNKYDTFTWTWDGPGVLRLLWYTMSQFYNRCEIEYLPVYKPSAQEKADANLYAKNVREVMAKALGVPTSEFSFEDIIMMNRARDLKIPFTCDIVEIERTLHRLGLLDSNRSIELAASYLSDLKGDRLDVITFSEVLQVSLQNPNLHALFKLMDNRHIGNVSLKNCLLCSIYCKLRHEAIIKFLRAISSIYVESDRRIDRERFAKIVRHAGGKLSPNKIDEIFLAVDQSHKGFISFDDFEKYTRDREEYKFLYKKSEDSRRVFPEN